MNEVEKLYAIVDIETTGGHAAGNGITEVAILIHDGRSLVDEYQTLINPGCPIPIYIKALTGIDEQMVESAPRFDEVAETIQALLMDKIFVAHNVNFDYSFLNHQLAAAGFPLPAQTKKLCTVRLARKIFPGHTSYSLPKICKALNIPNEAAHRAGGDAKATAILFGMMMEKDEAGLIGQSLKKGSKEAILPANLPKEQFEALPNNPGVYYFYNDRNEIIYIGKALELRKRVLSHFSNNKTNKQKQDFMREIHRIDFRECGSELFSLVTECMEIQRYWPLHNRALKQFTQAFGLYLFDAQDGYKRFVMSKKIKGLSALSTFNSLGDGYRFLYQLAEDYELCSRLCSLHKEEINCIAGCRGACKGEEPLLTYNHRVDLAIESVNDYRPSFALFLEGRMEGERACLLIDKGEFCGMGFIDEEMPWSTLTDLKDALTPYPANEYVKNLVYLYALEKPESCVFF